MKRPQLQLYFSIFTYIERTEPRSQNNTRLSKSTIKNLLIGGRTWTLSCMSARDHVTARSSTNAAVLVAFYSSRSRLVSYNSRRASLADLPGDAKPLSRPNNITEANMQHAKALLSTKIMLVNNYYWIVWLPFHNSFTLKWRVGCVGTQRYGERL